MKLYKLTDSSGMTKNNTQWGENITHTATGKGKELCSDGFIHAYTNPYIAILMNPIHANFNNPVLWEAEGEIVLDDNGLKCGVKSLTTLRRIPVPTITTTQRVAFAILCSLQVYRKETYVRWATHWLDGTDRSFTAADAAYAAAYAATTAAAAAAYTSATAAATAAATATYAAAYAAADAAAATADAATANAAAATAAPIILNFDQIVQEALTY